MQRREEMRRRENRRPGAHQAARCNGAGLALACCCVAGLALALMPVSSDEALLAALFAPLAMILGGMAVHGPVAAVAGWTLIWPGRFLACLVQRPIESATWPVVAAMPRTGPASQTFLALATLAGSCAGIRAHGSGSRSGQGWPAQHTRNIDDRWHSTGSRQADANQVNMDFMKASH